MSSCWWCDRISLPSSPNHRPPSGRTERHSQLGALTRLSFSTVRPATSARNRLYTPATYVAG